MLRPLPAGFASAVAALHRVAEEVVAPAREPRLADWYAFGDEVLRALR